MSMFNRMKNQNVHIKRYTREELDKAIADLEKRGFVCIRQWTECRGYSTYKQAKDGGFDYKGDTDSINYYAVMKKEEAV